MPVIDESVIIQAEPATVFDFLVDGENLPTWDSSIISCKRVGPLPIEVGSRFRGVSRIMGKQLEWTTEVVELIPGVRAVSRSVEGALSFAACYEVGGSYAGTTVRYVLVADSGLAGAFGSVMEPLVTRAQAKVVRGNLTRLAARFELPKAV